jgi:peptidyl-prolyl cis-trans isomerase B (cyclophilin B)
VLALEARGRVQRLERGAVIEVLESVANRDTDRGVRTAARAALSSLGGQVVPARAPAGRQELAAFRQIAARAGEPVDLVVVTQRGRISVRLDCVETPKSCVSVVQLARQGFYDDQRVEALEPGVQWQFGDPTGSGFGDAGYRLIAETTAAPPAVAGLLVLDCPYLAGCATRLRLTLTPQPWLTEGSVWLGRITDGLDVLRSVAAGDRIVTVEVVER